MTPWVLRLVIANVAVFFVQATQPGLVQGFLFTPALILHQPWTILTYMFLHAGPIHLLGNMMGLYFFGSQVESKLGSQRFIMLYFISGIAGAALSFAFAPHVSILGASGGVFGVMLAFAKYWPRVQIMVWGIIPVEARVFVMIMTVFSLWSGARGSQFGVADFAHLGGFVGAWAYLRWLETHTGIKKFRAQSVPKVADRSLSNWKRVNPNSVHELNRDELNRILDKIQDGGMNSLTPQERAFLLTFVPPDDRPPPPVS